MNYLVIDLEMCNVPKINRRNGFNCKHEIIQIGAVMLDEEYVEIGRLSQYVHPQYGNIDRFIENLTGIKSCDVKHAPILKDALEYLLNWIGDREYEILQWSNSDCTQLTRELKEKDLMDERLVSFTSADKWIDYQRKFDQRFDYSKSTSLEQALILCNIV